MDFFAVAVSFRSGVFKETNLIKGQRLTPGLEACVGLRQKERWLEEKLHRLRGRKDVRQGTEGRNELARAAMLGPARPNAPLEGPGLGERKQSGSRAERRCQPLLAFSPSSFETIFVKFRRLNRTWSRHRVVTGGDFSGRDPFR